MELYTGRPESTEGRLPREVRTYDFLDRLGIGYQRTDHERADNMEACNVVICKNLFLCNRQKTVFYLLMMPGDKKFRTKELSSQINSARLSFADPEDMLKYLDIEPGAVSIMGLMNDTGHDVQLLVDWFDRNKDHRITLMEKEAIKLMLRKVGTVGELADTLLKLLRK